MFSVKAARMSELFRTPEGFVAALVAVVLLNGSHQLIEQHRAMGEALECTNSDGGQG
jgi:hypothetical protein